MASRKLNPGRAKASNGKDARAEFVAVLPALSAKLATRQGADKALAALAKLKANPKDLDELIGELAAIEPELRACIDDVQPHHPEVARGLSKLADVAAMADILSEDEMLERLEFMRVRA